MGISTLRDSGVTEADSESNRYGTGRFQLMLYIGAILDL